MSKKKEPAPIWERIGEAMREAGIRQLTVFGDTGFSVHTRNSGWGTGATLDEAICNAETRRVVA